MTLARNPLREHALVAFGRRSSELLETRYALSGAFEILRRIHLANPEIDEQPSA